MLTEIIFSYLVKGREGREGGRGVKLTSLVRLRPHNLAQTRPRAQSAWVSRHLHIPLSQSQLSEQKMEETSPILPDRGGNLDEELEEEMKEEMEEEMEEVEESRYGWMVVAASFLCNVVIDGESPLSHPVNDINKIRSGLFFRSDAGASDERVSRGSRLSLLCW